LVPVLNKMKLDEDMIVPTNIAISDGSTQFDTAWRTLGAPK